MKYWTRAVICFAAILATAACGGHNAGSVSPPLAGGSAGQPDFAWGAQAMRGATFIGPASATHLQVNVMVAPQDAPGLIAYGQEASDPGSPIYRQWLTPQEIGDRFGATQSDYQRTAEYFVSRGLSVAGWPQRIMLSVAGSQAAMERAFGTKFGVYERNGTEFIAPMSPPQVAVALPIVAVQNLVTYNVRHTYIIPSPPRAVAAYGIGYSPQQIQNAFDYEGAYKKGFNGTGITVGIIGTGPINVSRSNLCADKDLAALQALENNVKAGTLCEKDVTPTGVAAGLAQAGIPTAAAGTTPNPLATESPNPGVSPASMFPYSGDFQTPPPVTGACGGSLPGCNPEDLEAQLDTQQIATLAPGSNVSFYLAYNAADCSNVYFPTSCATPPPAPATPKPNGTYGQPEIGIVEADPEIEQAIADDTADVISISYGGGEYGGPNDPQSVGYAFNLQGVGFEPMEFAALAAEGVAVFASSGDSGSAECLAGSSYEAKPCVGYPSGDPNVTSVGGVNAPLNEFGEPTTPMTAWGTTTALGTSGSGGGVSQIFPAPPWQKTEIGATMRTQPDVSMIGDPFTGVTVYTNFGLAGGGSAPSGPSPVGGTSVAAPEMAAMWALVLDACKITPSCAKGAGSYPYRLGNAAPLLYGIYAQGGAGAPPAALPYAEVFDDVAYGSNAMCAPGASVPACGTPVPGFAAGQGYDEVTGIGVPYAGHLIDAIVNPTPTVP